MGHQARPPPLAGRPDNVSLTGHTSACVKPGEAHLRSQAAVVFATIDTVTLRRFYLLFFIDIPTRTVYFAGVTVVCPVFRAVSLLDPDLWLMDEPFGALDAQTRLTVQPADVANVARSRLVKGFPRF